MKHLLKPNTIIVISHATGVEEMARVVGIAQDKESYILDLSNDVQLEIPVNDITKATYIDEGVETKVKWRYELV